MNRKAKDLFEMANQSQSAEMHVDLSVIHDLHANLLIETIENLFEQNLSENEIHFIHNKNYFDNKQQLNEILGAIAGGLLRVGAGALATGGQMAARQGLSMGLKAGGSAALRMGAGQAARAGARRAAVGAAQSARQSAASAMSRNLGGQKVASSSFNRFIKPDFSGVAQRTTGQKIMGNIGIGMRRASRSSLLTRGTFMRAGSRVKPTSSPIKPSTGAANAATEPAKKGGFKQFAKDSLAYEGGMSLLRGRGQQAGGGGGVENILEPNKATRAGTEGRLTAAGGTTRFAGRQFQSTSLARTGGQSSLERAAQTRGTIKRNTPRSASAGLIKGYLPPGRGKQSEEGIVDNYVIKASKDVAIILNEGFDIPYDKQIIENIIKIVREKI